MNNHGILFIKFNIKFTRRLHNVIPHAIYTELHYKQDEIVWCLSLSLSIYIYIYEGWLKSS